MLAVDALSESRRRYSLVALFVWLLLSVLVPVWLWLQLSDGEFRAATGLALLVCAYSAFRLAMQAYAGQPRLLATTFFVFVYVWGGTSPFVQSYAWIFPWGLRHYESDAWLGMMQIVLAVVAYELGQLGVCDGRRGIPRHFSFGVSQRAVLLLSLAALPLMLAGIIVLGGFDVLFTTRGGFTQSVSGSKMDVLLGKSLLRAPVFVAFILACIVCHREWHQMQRKRKQLFIVLLAYTGVLALIGNYPLSLPRQWMGTVFLTPLFMLLPWHRWQVATLGVGLVAVVLFIFPYADALRRETTANISVIDKMLKTRTVDNLLKDPDFDIYQQTLNAMVVVRREGVSYGRNLMGAILFWVPRRLWHDKPYGTGETVAFMVHYPWHQRNLSAPLWMEGYWAFGWPGLILLLYCYGLVSRKLDDAFITSRSIGRSSDIALVAVPFLAAYQFILMRGDILHGVAQMTPVVVLFLFATTLRGRETVPKLSMQGSGTGV